MMLYDYDKFMKLMTNFHQYLFYILGFGRSRVHLTIIWYLLTCFFVIFISYVCPN